MLFEDERLGDGELAPRGDLGPPHATDLDALEEDRGVVRQLTCRRAAEGDLQPGLAGADQGRTARPLKAVLHLARVIVPRSFDVDTAQNGAQARYPLQGDLRLNDPEHGGTVDERRDGLVHPNGRNHLAQPFGEAHVFNPPDGDVAVFQLRLAGGDARAAFELDLDLRSALIIGAPRDSEGNDKGQQRDKPDDGGSAEKRFARGRHGNFGWGFTHLSWHPHRGSGHPISCGSRRLGPTAS